MLPEVGSWQFSQELACAVYTDLHYEGDVMLMVTVAAAVEMVRICSAFHLFGAMFFLPWLLTIVESPWSLKKYL